MEVTKNKSLLDRKHFILRAIEYKNMNAIEGEKELDKLDKEIAQNLKEVLSKENQILKEELSTVKNVVLDIDVKRGAAKIIINLLKSYFTDQEIKGIARQMYKIMRGR